MWRGISLRKLALLLLGPLFVESLSMLFNAWMPLQAAEHMGRAPRQVMLIGMLGAAAYSASSLIAGRWVTAAIAPKLMIGVVIATLGVGCATLYVNQFWIFPICAAMIGLLYGHFYVPFQINMGHVQPFRTLAWSIAFYNMAWGAGGAIGTSIGGFFTHQPVYLIALVALAVAVFHTLLQINALHAPPPDHQENAATAFESTPRQRRVAFLCFLAGGLCFRGVLLTLWPSIQPLRQYESWQTGAGYFLLSIPITALAPLWALLRRRLHQPHLMIASMILGMIGMLIVPLAAHWIPAMIGLLLVGSMESCCCFHAIYYANADTKTAARSVGWVEVLSGMGSVVGPLLLGLAAWNNAAALSPYLLGAALLAAATAYTLWERVRNGPM